MSHKKIFTICIALAIIIVVSLVIKNNSIGRWNLVSGAVDTTSCSTGQARSISQYGITWTFSSCVQYGTFANGDYWVIGPLTLTGISPGTTDAGWKLSGGTMLNPTPNETQGLYRNLVGDGIVPKEYKNGVPIYETESWKRTLPAYDANKNISTRLPYTVTANNSVVSTIDNPQEYGTDQEKTHFKEIAILTVLGTVPAEGSFRPPYAGTNKTIKSNWKKSTLDLPTAGYSKLRSLRIPISGNAPTWDFVEKSIQRPLLEMTNQSDINSTWKASWASTKTGGYPRRTYGREVGHIAGGVGLMLNSNASNTQKEKALIYMAQWGIDNYGLANNGMQWVQAGGHSSGRLLSFFIAGKVLDDADILGKINPSVTTIGEIASHFFVDQNHIDTPRNAHTPPFKPYTQNMLNLPEWSSSASNYELGNKSSAFCEGGDDPNNRCTEDGVNWWGVPYRTSSGASNMGPIVTILLMGGRSDINQGSTTSHGEAFIRYQTERFYPRQRPAGNRAFEPDGNAINPFVRDMYDAYVLNGVLPVDPVVSNTPTHPAPNSFVCGDRVVAYNQTWVNSTPSVSTPIGGTANGPQQLVGATGIIKSGPISAENIYWYDVDYTNSVDGFSGGNNFDLVSHGACSSTTDWIAGPVDKIISISGPTNIQRNGTFGVTITYTASTNRDIVLELKKGDGVFYSDVRVPVTIWTNQSVTAQIQVPSTVQVGAELNYLSFMTPTGGGWSTQTSFSTQSGIYATSNERVCRPWN